MRKYCEKQLSMGKRIEEEHRDTLKFIRSYHRKHKTFPSNSLIYKKIAANHLDEDPKYYSKLKKCKL